MEVKGNIRSGPTPIVRTPCYYYYRRPHRRRRLHRHHRHHPRRRLHRHPRHLRRHHLHHLHHRHHRLHHHHGRRHLRRHHRHHRRRRLRRQRSPSCTAQPVASGDQRCSLALVALWRGSTPRRRAVLQPPPLPPSPPPLPPAGAPSSARARWPHPSSLLRSAAPTVAKRGATVAKASRKRRRASPSVAKRRRASREPRGGRSDRRGAAAPTPREHLARELPPPL